MKQDPPLPRISVTVTQETYDRYQKHIHWGMRSEVLAILIEDLLTLIEKDGDKILLAIMRRILTVDKVLQTGRKNNGTK